jgi:glyoxylase-like metal-dependent hydrolase (beta-lactamase superfamily II)
VPNEEDSSLQLKAIYTPGHLDDHMSFLVQSASESLLISGDILLGSPSAVIDDLDVYLRTLKSLQKLKIDHILLPHSLGMEPEQIIVPAAQKLEDYIEYRETRLQ